LLSQAVLYRFIEEASMIRWTNARRLVSVALAAAFTACSEPTAPSPSAVGLSLFPEEPKKSALLECPTDVTETASALLGFAGGDVSLGGNLVSVPEGALPLLGLSLVTLTVPASKYVEVEAHVNGLPYVFAQPVKIVIDYSRCTRSNIDHAPLTAWYIDSATKALLENMGGTDDKMARNVTFFTDHFSGYAVAQ
jgi:hypothetical protein